MERGDFELLVMLDREGTLTAAAVRLRTAQPALSRRLGRLERELGVVLFERGRHGAVSTPAGRVVVESARRALEAISETERTARRAATGEAGILRVGTTPTLGADVLPPALASFRAAHPRVHLELTSSGDSAELGESVRVGDLDLAVAVVPPQLGAGLVVERSGQQAFVAVVAADDPLARGPSVAHSDLRRRPIVAVTRGEGLRILLESIFATHIDELDIAIETTEREMLIPFVAAGLGVTIVPRHFALKRSGRETVVLPLDPEVRREVGVLQRATQQDVLAHAFADLVRFEPDP